MKAKGIASKVVVKDDVMEYTLTDVGSGEKETIPLRLSSYIPQFRGFPDFVQSALVFGIRTRIRNETAGEDFQTAVANIKATLDDWASGLWATARRAGGESKLSVLALAISAASTKGLTPEGAADLINNTVLGAMKAEGIDPEDDSDEAKKAKNKIRAKVRAAFFEKHKKVKAEFDRITAERAAAKAAASAETAASADVAEEI